jgi:hypothetical protein
VRRLSVASPDSGAESPVYGDEPADRAGRGDSPSRAARCGDLATPAPSAVRAASAATVLGAPPRPAARPLVRLAQSAWLPAPSSATAPSVCQPGSDPAAKTELVSQQPIFFPRQRQTGFPVGPLMYSIATPGNCDMSVVDQQNGRWYVKDIRASMLPMRIP